MSVISDIKTIIRSLTEDVSKSDYETFTYTNSSTFTLATDNIESITSVLKNGTTLSSGDYSYDSDANQITISASLSDSDSIKVNFDYYEKSDSNLNEYIRGALAWIDVYDYGLVDYELKGTVIYPTPDSKTQKLIAIIASILIKPDWNEYRTPSLTVKYSKKMSKEDRIEKLIFKYKFSEGVNETLESTIYVDIF